MHIESENRTSDIRFVAYFSAYAPQPRATARKPICDSPGGCRDLGFDPSRPSPRRPPVVRQRWHAHQTHVRPLAETLQGDAQHAGVLAQNREQFLPHLRH